MKQWVILSGKGGTGKTTVAAALAHLAARERRVVLADADVDAANLELLLEPRILQTHDYVGGQVAHVNPALCNNCGICAEFCRFDAVATSNSAHHVEALACEGCAACAYACPAGAIAMLDRVSGRHYRSETRFGPLYHARLTPGQENSGKLVTQVKQNARADAVAQGAELLLVDGPPGIGCPVIAALTGADLALLVTEPSVSGVHDWERILGTMRHFGVQPVVCVNKADIHPRLTAQIRARCAEERVPFLAELPFDMQVVEATVRRRPLTEYGTGPAAQALVTLWGQLEHWLL
jgi:MinD superfamily P-loop ATPase